ncbi:valine--tRNA ligase [Patescibacteria group bacterium]|nr:valine--tRNA ligase [Patescibacteria group bacterium]
MKKSYNPQKYESKIYSLWEKGNFFKPDFKRKQGKFCIIMPPPNANASLHVGHAVFVTLEDIMVRYHRLKGKTVLWVPGADHAGFETQVVFERHLEEQGKNRFQFSRSSLYKMMFAFTKKNKKLMEGQLKKLGASCDWSREKFTLDDDVIKIVCQTFKKLFRDGLIYRGARVINWCSHHQTSLSDLEVVYQKQKTKLIYIKYPIHNSRKFIVVATTRPETMLGDTAVAVNPKDKKYQSLLKNKINIRLPLTERVIPLISDEAIDPDFGTGAVKVTPAHDPIDFEISQRHNLEAIEIIGKDDKIVKEASPNYSGLSVFQARVKIIEDLKRLKLIKKEEDYSHQFPVCYKCKKPIEHLISDQWFIKIKPLAERAVMAVKKKEIQFTSKRFEKVFFNWMKNIRDWNISRQIAWGIKIPVWYCQEKKNKKCQNKQGIIISSKKPNQCPYCKSKKLKEETDTFDTWFSSGQWPFAVLGYPNSKDYKFFYPTSVMETGWDILFFWVARMIMLGLYCTGQVPFKYVYLHGLVRDKDRQKMSKSKGNVIDPLMVVEKYGADALRMALVFGSSSQNDIVVSEEKILTQQRFLTKIWNASRFVLQNLGKDFSSLDIDQKALRFTKKDKWILKEMEDASKKIAKNIESFNFHIAAEEAYHFFWHKFCDKTIEDVKQRLYSEESDIQEKQTGKWVLYTVLLNSLKLLHPFIPFITEEIYQMLHRKSKRALIIESWPKIKL